jgi:ABC-2 type transport system permease protein
MTKSLFPLINRLLVETRFFLGFSLIALFGLSWFSVLRTSWSEGRQETVAIREQAQRGELAKAAPKKASEKKDEPKAEIAKDEPKSEPAKDETKTADASATPPAPPRPPDTDAQRQQRRARGFYQFMGGPDMDMSSGAIETMMLYFLTVGIPIMIPLFWGISRGSAAVAAEIERGTMDMILSRPVSRTSYLMAHVITTVIGFALMIVFLIAGNKVAEQFHSVDMSPSIKALARPAINVVAMGLATFGITLAMSAWDLVRWRPNMIASILTIAQLVGYAVGNQPGTEDDSWYKVPGKLSIFSTFYPIEGFVKGEKIGFNVMVLSAVFVVGVIAAILRFNSRDLPANS